MNIIAFNGSPRKNRNTAALLEHALKGAASEGAQTELIHLYEHDYKGCTSCFACKLKGGKSYGRCAVKDGLTPLLEKIEKTDAMIIGSPIFFGDVTGEVRSFLERLLFPYLVYDENYSSLFTRRIPVGFIYTMNVNESRLEQAGYKQRFLSMEQPVARIIGATKSLYVTDTYQFDDYSKYVVTSFSADAKAKRHADVFPHDCQHAFDMGAELARQNTLS